MTELVATGEPVKHYFHAMKVTNVNQKVGLNRMYTPDKFTQFIHLL